MPFPRKPRFFNPQIWLLAGLFLGLAATSFGEDPAAKIRAGLERALKQADYSQKSLQAKLQDVSAEEWQGFRIVGKDLDALIEARDKRQAKAQPTDLHKHDEGHLTCAVCGAHLFDFGDRQDEFSPDTLVFSEAQASAAVVTDRGSAWTYANGKLELRCAVCGAHLGHVDPGHTAADPLRFIVEPPSLDLAAAESGAP